MKLLPYLLGVLLLTGCAPEEEEYGGEIWVQVIHPENQAFLLAAREAAAQWDICPGHKVHIEIDPIPGSATLTLVPPSDPDLEGHIGVTTPDRRVKVSNTVPQDILPGLISHEFGHLLGYIKHTKSGIMKDGLTTPMSVSPEDCQ